MKNTLDEGTKMLLWMAFIAGGMTMVLLEGIWWIIIAKIN